MRRLLAAAIVALVLTGCGAANMNAERQAVEYTDKILTGLGDAYVGIDRAYQESVRKDKAKLASYRADVQPKVLLAFAEARAAVAAWRATAELYALGKASAADVDAKAAEVENLVRAIQGALSAIGGR